MVTLMIMRMTSRSSCGPMIDKLHSSTVDSRIKVDKTEAESVIEWLNEKDGVTAKQVSTDEFDIPPTAIIRVKVDLHEH